MVLFGRAETAKAAQPAEQQGRFRIFQLEYESAVNHAMYKNTDVFRIDPQTGDTWKYLDVIND